MFGRWSAAFALIGVLTACPEGPKPTDIVADVTTDTGGRTALLGGLAMTYRVEGADRWVLSTEPLFRPPPPAPDAAGDATSSEDADAGPVAEPTLMVEAVVLPAYLYGVPWTEFAAEETPQQLPGAWVSALHEARDTIAALGKPVVLALSPLSLEWDNLAPLASDDGSGGLKLEENWLQDYCHDPAKSANPTKWRVAYGRYAKWMTELVKPAMVIVGSRLNLYEANCGEAYEAIVGFATEAHEVVKGLSDAPTTIVSVDVEDLYGYPRIPGRCPSTPAKECFATRQALLANLKADRLGLESYPARALTSKLAEIPDDWLVTVAEARSDLPPVIAGTGLPAVRLETVSGTCVPLLESSDTLQVAWLDQVLATATTYKMDLAVWNSPVNRANAARVSACLCSGDATLCGHLAQLGAKSDSVRLRLVEGLFAQDGSAYQAGLLWTQVLGLDAN